MCGPQGQSKVPLSECVLFQGSHSTHSLITFTYPKSLRVASPGLEDAKWRQDSRLGRSARGYIPTRALRPHPKYLKWQGRASSEPSRFQGRKEVTIWQTPSGLPKFPAMQVW